MKFIVEHTFEPFDLDRYWQWAFSEDYFEFFGREGSRQNYIVKKRIETDEEVIVSFETHPSIQLPKVMSAFLKGKPVAFNEEHIKSKKEYVDRLTADLAIDINFPYSTVGVDTWEKLDDGKVRRVLDMDLNVKIKFFRKKAEESLVGWAKGGQLAYNRFMDKWIKGEVDPGFKISE